MRLTTPTCTVFIWLLLLTVGLPVRGAGEKILFEVQDPANLPKYVVADGKAQVVSTAKGKALRVDFHHSRPWPHILLRPDRLGYPEDWRGYGLLAVSVSNPGAAPVRVFVRLDSAANARAGRQAGTTLEPGARARLLLPFAGRPIVPGMIGQPPVPYPEQPGDVVLRPRAIPVDPSKITGFQVFIPRPRQDHTILIHRIALLPAPAALARRPFTDRFGQYTDGDWPGKLHAAAEFPARIAAEQRDLAAHPPPSDRDRFGGWAGGPELEATGRFRVTKYQGKWWFVDPEGRLFWSSGIDCVRYSNPTIIAGREWCFEWLPKPDDPMARFYSGRGRNRKYDFFQANLFRKYGPDYADRFFDLTLRRLRSWGVNTIGNWSSPDAWRRHAAPYTIPVHVPHAPMFVAASHMKAGKEKRKCFPDPFNPAFRTALEKQLDRFREFRDDPWLLGVFIGNELPWAIGSPWARPDAPLRGIGLLCLEKNEAEKLEAKRVLLARLREKYADIATLNRAWGTRFHGWKQLDAPFELTTAQIAQARADVVMLDSLMAEQYFRVCREAMRAKLPGVLYLGCRFSGAYAPHIVRIAAKYCDVVSFNIYAERPSDRTADELASAMDFPVLIGEFHFGALDRGMFHPGLRRARNQKERAGKYAAYIREAAAAPWCVGAHWFQYLDQPLTGRPDGENYNIGFVDATDDPYPEMRAAAREVNGDLYRVRSGR